MKTNVFAKSILLLLLLIWRPVAGKAYSVLTHEALVDVCWNSYLVPSLKQKYPSIDSVQLKEAHAFAYGGSVAADMGYYPFGSKLFTDLVHYVRTGDFIEALLQEASNADEYAFALGMLCHYYADIYGHRLAVNICVPMEYPKARKKYGDVVAYAQDKVAHKRVEFAFDVVETAKGNYASRAYMDFIGFEVADSVLERAFYKTYGVHLKEIFPSFPRAVNTFRWAVRNVFPGLTKAAWSSKKSAIQQQHPGLTARDFRFKMRRANYNKKFGRDRDKPGILSFLFGELFKLLPKLGPLAPLKFKAPGAREEKLFVQSFDSAQLHYSNALMNMNVSNFTLADKDLDTGESTKAGEYKLADKTYGRWLLKLEEKGFASVEDDLKKEMLLFFDGKVVFRERPAAKRKIDDALSALRRSRFSPPVRE